MSNDATSLAKHRSWPRFVGFFLLLCLVGGAVTWLAWPKTVTATALFGIRNEMPTVTVNSSPRSLSEHDYEVLKNTQLALLKSKFLLTAALRDPGIGSLSLFAGVPDPEQWLQDHLDVGFPENGEILAISLSGSESQAHELAKVVDAVADAYKKEVLGKETSRRLNIRDMLERSLQNLNSEIKRKYEDYLDIAKGMGQSTGSNDLQLKLDMKRLDRVDDELAQLERDQLRIDSGNDGKDGKFIAARMDQLRKRQTELEKAILKRNEKSVDLETRAEELRELQKIANEMNVKLEKMDIDSQVPAQIEQLQKAVIDPLRLVIQ